MPSVVGWTRKKRSPPGSVKSMKVPGRSVSRWAGTTAGRSRPGPGRSASWRARPAAWSARPRGGSSRVRPCQTIVPAGRRPRRRTPPGAAPAARRARRRPAPPASAPAGPGAAAVLRRPAPPWGRSAVVALAPPHPARHRRRVPRRLLPGRHRPPRASPAARPARFRDRPPRGAPVLPRRRWLPPSGIGRRPGCPAPPAPTAVAGRPEATWRSRGRAGPGWPGWPGP